MSPRPKKKKIKAEEVEEKLKEILGIEHVYILSEGDEVYRKYDMGYAIAIVKRRFRGQTLNKLVPALVRFNVKQFRINAIVPLEPEAIKPLFDLVNKAMEKIAEIEEEERRKRQEEKFKKFLETLSPEEREILEKLMRSEK